MKIFKLDRRFRNGRLYGHTIGLEFNRWSIEAREVEDYMRNATGEEGFRLMPSYPSYNPKQSWCGYFEHKAGHIIDRKYYITFTDESYLSMMVLSGVIDEIN